jgi:hypothetical protein
MGVTNGDFLIQILLICAIGYQMWGGEIVVPRPSASASLTGRRQKPDALRSTCITNPQRERKRGRERERERERERYCAYDGDLVDPECGVWGVCV